MGGTDSKVAICQTEKGAEVKIREAELERDKTVSNNEIAKRNLFVASHKEIIKQCIEMGVSINDLCIAGSLSSLTLKENLTEGEILIWRETMQGIIQRQRESNLAHNNGLTQQQNTPLKE